MISYKDFLLTKVAFAPETGFEISKDKINTALKPHQRDAVMWAVKGGRRALFEAFGLGKTVQELEWCRIITAEKGGKALIVMPLGVRQEFTKDAQELLGIPVPQYVRTMAEVKAAETQIVITNYERVRDGDIDPTYFTAAALDEASCLRDYGSKTYQTFTEKFKGVPYKLVATATPSPNRYKELIHYAGFLEIMDTGQALAQPLTAKVLTPTGWKQMGDIAIGDDVITVDGTPTKVTGIYPQGVKKIYKVYFSDGSFTKCTADHLWTTQTQYERNACKKFLQRNPEKSAEKYWTVKQTSEIMQTLRCKSTWSKNHMIPMVKPVQFCRRNVKIDPYLMGLILGDGNIRETSVGYTTADSWIVEEIRRIVLPLGLNIIKNEHVRKDGQPNYDYRISAGLKGRTGRGHKSNVVLNAMHEYGLVGKRAWEKFVPEDYLFNTPEIRISVLQGLMDSDGTISSNEKVGTVHFVTTSRKLADNVIFIVQSMGGTVHVKTTYGTTPAGKPGRLQYKVTIRLPNGINPFRLPRKAELVRDKIKYIPKRYINKIEYCGEEEAQCIMVAHDKHLYITDNFIVTHNTRFFQRDSTKANNLTLYPHKEQEFWLWLSSWSLFITKPSDLGYDDTGYALPPMEINYHVVSYQHKDIDTEKDGQVKLLADAAVSLKDAAKIKRDSIDARVAKMVDIVEANPDDHFILWHDLEAERHAIKKALPEAVEVYGSQDYDIREKRVIGFAKGDFKLLATKKSLSGQGCNFQYHCHRAIFLGIDYEFNDFIQAIHRIYRFMQTEKVIIDIIYTEEEQEILRVLLQKWKQHTYMADKMTEIIKKYGLANTSLIDKLARTMGVERVEVTGKYFKAVNNDCILETEQMADNSVDLIVTSIPFSNHYEYTATYNDFGHNQNTQRFFEQMDYLTPNLLRILRPGRVFACHVKDRVLFGNATGTGMPTMEPFHAMCIKHYMEHGFMYFGMITVVTDVVRENNQTYRLGWTEQCKDGTKMGVGCPEYILLFRKLPTDTSRAYADVPVTKDKADYTRAQWQIDAHGFWRSSGDRLLTKAELQSIPVDNLQAVYRKYSRENVYSYEEHVALAKRLDENGKLPASFMVVAPGSWNMDVWDDINRMRTLNTNQTQKRKQTHLCPLQLDVVERLINRYSNPGDVVLDPFGGLMTVPLVAVQKERFGIGIELSADYFRDGVGYLQTAEMQRGEPTLFDFIDV